MAFLGGLFKKKPGGTFVGNLIRGVASGVTGGLIGNGKNRLPKDYERPTQLATTGEIVNLPSDPTKFRMPEIKTGDIDLVEPRQPIDLNDWVTLPNVTVTASRKDYTNIALIGGGLVIAFMLTQKRGRY